MKKILFLLCISIQLIAENHSYLIEHKHDKIFDQNLFLYNLIHHYYFVILSKIKHQLKQKKTPKEIRAYLIKEIEKALNKSDQKTIFPNLNHFQNHIAQISNYQHNNFENKRLLGSHLSGNEFILTNIVSNIYTSEIFTIPSQLEITTKESQQIQKIFRDIILNFVPEIFYITTPKNRHHVFVEKQDKNHNITKYDSNNITINNYCKNLQMQSGPHCIIYSTFLLLLTKIIGCPENAIKAYIEIEQEYSKNQNQQEIKKQIQNVFLYANLSKIEKARTNAFYKSYEQKAKLIHAYEPNGSLIFLIKQIIIENKIAKQKSSKQIVKDLIKKIGSKEILKEATQEIIENYPEGSKKRKSIEDDLKYLIPIYHNILNNKSKLLSGQFSEEEYKKLIDGINDPEKISKNIKNQNLQRKIAQQSKKKCKKRLKMSKKRSKNAKKQSKNEQKMNKNHLKLIK